MIHVHLGYLAGDGVDLVLILHAVHDKLHLVVPVVQIVLLLHELDVIPAQLGGEDVLGGRGIDVALVAVSVVIVVAVQGHGLGADLVGLHHQADSFGQLVEELVVGILRAPLQLEHNVLLVPVDGGVEIAAGVDLVHQLADHSGAGLTLIAGVGGQDGFAVLIEAGEGHHVARLVIVHFNFRIDAQQHRAHAAVGGIRRGGGGIGARGEGLGPGAAPAGGQGGEGQGGGEGQAKQLSIGVLFHFTHLLENQFCFLVCIRRLRGRVRKTGVFQKTFFFFVLLLFGLHGENTPGRRENRGRRKKFLLPVSRRHPMRRPPRPRRRHHHHHRHHRRRHRCHRCPGLRRRSGRRPDPRNR